MKFLALILCSSFAFSNPVLKDEIKRSADRIFYEVERSRLPDADLLEVKRLLDQSLSILLNNGPGDNTNADCMKWVMDQGYPPPTAKDVCQGLNRYSFQCVKYLGKQAGYPPGGAKNFCVNMDTQPEGQCMEYIVQKGYGPQTGSQICLSVTRQQFTCIKDVMDRGYDPMSAKRSCGP